jgi:peptide/nickel transport system substrate-binding protein
MTDAIRRTLAIGAAAGLACALAACGGSSSGGSGSAGSSGGTSGGYAPGGTLQVSMGSPPESLDPQVGYSSESEEADWLVYTPLLTYQHQAGTAGETLIPGLATAMPVVTDGGKTYTLTLRKGLKFANGAAVTASDFTYTIERAIKLWGGAGWYTGNIAGAAAYQAGKAHGISGISTDNATGQIVIHLVTPYGAFANILAFPAAGLIPAGTPMSAESTSPPPGVGPYKITSVQPNRSFTLKKNPLWAGFKIPGTPDGYVNAIQVTIQSNLNTEAQEVLDNQSDEFDWGDVLPPAYLQQIQAKATGRFRVETLAGTDYFWLNTSIKPFNNVLAREAANLAVNRVALERLASGQITPACYYVPPDIVGHASGPCPFGAPSGNGSYSAASLGSAADIALAKKLVARAHLTGSPVTVWTEERQPFQDFGTYLNAQLNAIGFKSTLDVVANSVYDPTIGAKKTDPQAGWSEWTQDFPNPGDFYYVLNADSILPVNNGNFGYVDDPHIQSEITRLNAVPASQLGSVAPQWAALEQYVAKKDFMVPFGYEVTAFFLSDRVDFAKAVFNPVYGDDWLTFELKK